MQDDFDQVLLGRLKKEKLAPAPRWRFEVKNYSIWTLGAASVAVGSVSFALIIDLVQSNDWAIYDEISDGFGQFLLLTLPYFWILLLVLFMSAAYYNIRHTRFGYRYPLSALLAASVLMSFAGGYFLYRSGFGRLADDFLGERAPYYREIMNPQMRFWDAPEHGRLMGVVSSTTADLKFLLTDMRASEWLIDCGVCSGPLPVIISAGRPVRLSGHVVDENVFFADRVLPVGPGRGMFRGRMMMGGQFPVGDTDR